MDLDSIDMKKKFLLWGAFICFWVTGDVLGQSCSEGQIADLILAGISGETISEKCENYKKDGTSYITGGEKITHISGEKELSNSTQKGEGDVHAKEKKIDHSSGAVASKKNVSGGSLTSSSSTHRRITGVFSPGIISIYTESDDHLKDDAVTFYSYFVGAELNWTPSVSSTLLWGGGNISESSIDDVDEEEVKGEITLYQVSLEYQWRFGKNRKKYFAIRTGAVFNYMEWDYTYQTDTAEEKYVGIQLSELGVLASGRFVINNWNFGFAYSPSVWSSHSVSRDNREVEIDRISSSVSRVFIAYSF